MDTKAYIVSGILELYVAGQLSEQENQEVANYANEYPEIKTEIIEIEKALLGLSAALAPKSVPTFDTIKNKLGTTPETKIIPLDSKRKKWTPYLGWAASALLTIGLAYLYNQNQELSTEVQIAETEMQQLELQISEANNSLEKSNQLLYAIRDKNITVVPLGGQNVSPGSYAKAYWNKEQKQLFIDAQGLPEPPDGMAYQVWSLTLDPLTPTSVGLLEDFIDDDNKVFAFVNPNESQAFGITLEPAGGSEFPTLEQLYVLGIISS